MSVYRHLLLLSCILFGFLLSAQENCSNGIDDDGDGLIDLNDATDCKCGFAATIPSLLPNPSLEEFDADQDGCASIQPGGLPDAPNQANCLVGWQRASIGTTDAWNAFTLSGSPPFFPSELPQPLPSGTGVAGFWIGVKDTDEGTFTNQDGTITTQYREYLAACLDDGSRLIAGDDYRLSFSLGFMLPQSFEGQQGNRVDMASPSPIELNVYGIRSCDQLYFGDFYNCPEQAGAEGYELITSVTVTGTPGEWTATSVDFTAGNNYAAFAIGGSCAADVGRTDSDYFRNYYFIDQVILNRPEAFDQPVAGPVAVSGQTICANEITLTGETSAGAAYQWYKDGIALVGETENVLVLQPSQDIDAAYVLRVETTAGCAVTDEVVIQRPILPDMVPDSVALCPQAADTIFLQPSRPAGATFEWSDGSTLGYFPVTEPGDYQVTVSTVCEQQIERFTAVVTDRISYEITTTPEIYCPGDTVTVDLETDFYLFGVAYSTLDFEPLIPESDNTLDVVIGETDSIIVQLFYGCEVVTDTLDLTPDEGFDLTAAITDLSCENPVGRIVLSVSNPDQIEYEWTDPLGNPIGTSSPNLDVDVPGSYSVLLADGVRCPANYTYEVVYADSFRLNLTLDSLSCGGDGSASILPSGGQPPYTVAWFRGTSVVPFAADTTQVGSLTSDDYRVEVTDASGCTRNEVFTLFPPDTLMITTTPSFADCNLDGTGILTVVPSGGIPPYTFRLNGGNLQTNGVFRDLPSGNYTVEVQDSRSCDPVTEEVVVTSPTLFTLELAEEKRIILGDSTLLELRVVGIPAETGRAVWSPQETLTYPFGVGSITVQARPAETTRYQVAYTSSEGCTKTQEILVVVNETVRIYVPSAFSPNGDNSNDELLVYPGPAVQQVLTFQVYNRWGGMVYEWNGEPETGWDGKVDGKDLNPGVYSYLVEAQLINGTQVSRAGAVTLVR